MSNPRRKGTVSSTSTYPKKKDLSSQLLRSPLRWFGGKGVLANRIINFFPPHHTYIEVFGGGASLLFRKRPSPIEIYNDINEPLFIFFTALRNPDTFYPLRDSILLTPYSRELYCDLRSKMDVNNPIDFFILNRQGFGGNNDTFSWSFAIKQSAINMSAATSKWVTTNQRLLDHHVRLQNVLITNTDFRELLEQHRDPNTLIYLDPPYLKSTRKDGGYNDEIVLRDHLDMLALIRDTPSMVVLSGYPSPHYEHALDKWQRVDFDMPCFAVGRVRGSSNTLGPGGLANHMRVECLWLSPATISALKISAQMIRKA